MKLLQEPVAIIKAAIICDPRLFFRSIAKQLNRHIAAI